MKLRKKQLEKIWKQLDGACEALERLGENGVDITEYFIDFSGIVALKNDVEELIQKKMRS